MKKKLCVTLCETLVQARAVSPNNAATIDETDEEKIYTVLYVTEQRRLTRDFYSSSLMYFILDLKDCTRFRE